MATLNFLIHIQSTRIAQFNKHFYLTFISWLSVPDLQNSIVCMDVCLLVLSHTVRQCLLRSFNVFSMSSTRCDNVMYVWKKNLSIISMLSRLTYENNHVYMHANKQVYMFIYIIFFIYVHTIFTCILQRYWKKLWCIWMISRLT